CAHTHTHIRTHSTLHVMGEGGSCSSRQEKGHAESRQSSGVHFTQLKPLYRFISPSSTDMTTMTRYAYSHVHWCKHTQTHTDTYIHTPYSMRSVCFVFLLFSEIL